MMAEESPVPADPLTTIAHQTLATTLGLRRGMGVIVESWTHMLPWARAFAVEARRMGIRPMVLYEDEEAYWRSLDRASAKELGQVGAPEWAALEAADGYVFLWGPEDRARLRELPEDVNEKLVSYNDEWYRRARKSHLRACRVEVGRATASSARRFGVDLGAWQAELVRASQVDPKEIRASGQRIAKALQKGRRLTVRHANGTALELRLLGRAPFVDDAIVDDADVRAGRNVCTVPGGAVAVAVDESFGAGRFRANRTSFLPDGPVVGGVWDFQAGKLSSFRYDSGTPAFEDAYAKAPDAKAKPGFFSVGLNPELRFAPNLEDQEKGVVTLGLGRNQGYGGKNSVDFSSWLVLQGAHVEVDGRAVVADGDIL